MLVALLAMACVGLLGGCGATLTSAVGRSARRRDRPTESKAGMGFSAEPAVATQADRADLTKVADQFTSMSTPGARAYKVGPQDVLDISVFKVPELTKSVQVAESGSINLPLVGEIQAAGKTAQDIERDLAKKLGAKYLQSPQVTVFVKEYNRLLPTQPAALLQLSDQLLLAELNRANQSSSEASAGGLGATEKPADARLQGWANFAQRAFDASNAPNSGATQAATQTSKITIDPMVAAQIRAWATAVLLRDPLNAHALRLLGQVAEKDQVNRLMEAATRRSIDESTAAYWLMRKNVQDKTTELPSTMPICSCERGPECCPSSRRR